MYERTVAVLSETHRDLTDEWKEWWHKVYPFAIWDHSTSRAHAVALWKVIDKKYPAITHYRNYVTPVTIPSIIHGNDLLVELLNALDWFHNISSTFSAWKWEVARKILCLLASIRIPLEACWSGGIITSDLIVNVFESTNVLEKKGTSRWQYKS
jgi:hypothetical protein